MDSYEGQADANSHVLIQNNTCDYYQDVGIAVFGVEEEADAGEVTLTNNIVSGSYQCGVVLANGWMYFTVSNTGYYDNELNKNWEFEEYNPVIETTFPYVEGGGTLPVCYLEQTCGFINTGFEYIEQTHLIGKTTDINSFPDSNLTDLGFHYPNWGYSNSGETNSLSADLDGNMRVDFNDFSLFALLWKQETVGPEDIDDSGLVDLNDLSLLCNQWLSTLSLGIVLNQDPNLVSGILLVELAGHSEELSYHLFLDGQHLGSFIGYDIEIPTHRLRNGTHEMKIIAATLDDEVIVGPPIQFIVQNQMYCLTAPEAYEFNNPYQFAGFYEPNGGSTINLQLKDLDETVIWTNSSNGNFNFFLPTGTLNSPYNQLYITETGGLKLNSWPEEWIEDIVRKFDVTNDPNTANAQSLLVCVKKRWTRDRREVWKQYLWACGEQSLAPTICLFYGQATRGNIQTALSKPGVKAVLIITDGNREIGIFSPIHRTFFEADDGLYFSYLRRNWPGDPNDYEELPSRFERDYSVSDLWSSFNSRPRMYVMIDACKNGTSVMPPIAYAVCGSNPPDNQYTQQEYERTADMAHAFAIYNDPLLPRLYISWRKEAFGSNPLLRYNSFLQRIWYQVGRYQNFRYAISDAATFEGGNCLVLQNLSYVGNADTTFGQ